MAGTIFMKLARAEGGGMIPVTTVVTHDGSWEVVM